MTAPEARSPGRPRNVDSDQRILRAVIEIVSEGGVAAVTVTGVAGRAGVARATVYLRWPSKAALIGAATKAVAGGKPFALSGDLARDIRFGADFMQGVISAPYFASILPELMRAVLATPPEISFDALAPNRERLAAEHRRVAAAQDFNPGVSPYLPFDMIFGAGLSHLLATGRPPSGEYMRELADAIVSGLRDRSA
jgi:AcrR family transcriptional regulator